MRINRLRPICKTERGPTRALIRIHTRLLVAALSETSGGHGVETLQMHYDVKQRDLRWFGADS
jgi:hypothetical protein